MKEIKISGTVAKSGTGYHIYLPKALIECGLIELGKQIQLTMVFNETETLKKEPEQAKARKLILSEIKIKV